MTWIRRRYSKYMLTYQDQRVKNRSKFICMPAIFHILLLVAIGGCVPMGNYSMQNSQPAIGQMTDLELLNGIQSTEAKLMQLGVTAQYLAMTRPAPTYTLTGTSFYTGSFFLYGNAGHFNFQGQSIYQLTPNYGAQIGHVIAGAIIATRINQAIQYRAALISEALSRIAKRETENQTTVENFYQVHSDLRGREPLVASVAPWVQVENPGLASTELLNAIASRARGIISQEGENLGGDWHGLLVQETIYQDGSKMPTWTFVKINITQSGDKIAGVGRLIDGQKLALQFTVDNHQLSGLVMNTTYNIEFGIKGTVAPTKMLVDYQSETTKRGRIIGQAILIR